MTSRVLSAIEDDRYGTLGDRRLQRLEDSGGLKYSGAAVHRTNRDLVNQ